MNYEQILFELFTLTSNDNKHFNVLLKHLKYNGENVIITLSCVRDAPDVYYLSIKFGELETKREFNYSFKYFESAMRYLFEIILYEFSNKIMNYDYYDSIYANEILYLSGR